MPERKCVISYRLVQHCNCVTRFKHVELIMHCGEECVVNICVRTEIRNSIGI